MSLTSMDSAMMEAVLQMQNQESAVWRVLKCEAQPALPKGENYLSLISRITLEVVLGNGKKSHKSLILKEAPHEGNNREFVNNLGVFKIETEMYLRILKQMEELMDEHHETEELLWGRLIFYQPYTSLLLEDLKATGFLMTQRQACLDLEHGHLVLHSLGRFHGMSKILEERGVINGKDFKPYALCNSKDLLEKYVHNGLRNLSEAMHRSWGPAWQRVAEKLIMPLEVLENKMIEIGKLEESRFNVVNHGDCWSNNMLFKYDWSHRPIAVRFLDFQISHYNSPSWDLTYFMFNSIEPKLRREHYESLLKTYSNSLLSTLQKYRYSGRLPTHEEIAAEMERIAFFRLIVVGVSHPIMTAEGTNALDMDELFGSGGTSGIGKDIYTETYKQRMGPEFLKLEEQGLIFTHI
ncbi:uncharacterized protein [Halyomorpha halys]|nr:uncharacterized protein LOC106684910 [Halyomorpha halys]KAE8573450.1 EcKinase 18 [Halyomorpha halys]